MNVTITWEPDVAGDSPLVHPEFHEDLVCTVHQYGTDRTVEIRRQGEARLRVGECTLTTPADFRTNFPDGILPDDDPDQDIAWVFNAWFDAYETFSGADREDEHLDCVGFTLAETLGQVLRHLGVAPDRVHI